MLCQTFSKELFLFGMRNYSEKFLFSLLQKHRTDDIIHREEENKQKKEKRKTMSKFGVKRKMTTGRIEDEQGITGVVGMILSFGVYDDSHDSDEESSFSYDDGLVKRYYEIAPYYCVVDENGPLMDDNDNLKVFPLFIGPYGHKPTIGLISLIEQEIDRMFSINY